jgi:hypothetical protein
MLKGNFDTNYFKLLMILRVFKVDCHILTLFLAPNLKSVAQIEWKKIPIYIFSTFGSKINEFERKKVHKKLPLILTHIFKLFLASSQRVSSPSTICFF